MRHDESGNGGAVQREMKVEATKVAVSYAAHDAGDATFERQEISDSEQCGLQCRRAFNHILSTRDGHFKFETLLAPGQRGVGDVEFKLNAAKHGQVRAGGNSRT